MAEQKTNCELSLKYGLNPHQTNARVSAKKGLPFEVLNGKPGTINIMEALRGWSLVNELDNTFLSPSVACLKHKNPAGAAICVPKLDDRMKEFYSCKGELSNMAIAYYKADGTDPKSAYGGTVVLSRELDYETALAIKPRVVDVVVAPGFDEEGLEILMAKKNGKIVILRHNCETGYPEKVSVREKGVEFEFDYNHYRVTDDLLEDVIGQPLTDDEKRDLKLGVVIAKYTKSNKTIYTLDGQSAGIMPCQQSRVDSIRWAGEKAMTWLLRQTMVSSIEKPKKIYDRISEETEYLEKILDGKTKTEKKRYVERAFRELGKDKFRAVTCGFLPFPDCVIEAHNHGVGTILYPKAPGKGIRFDEIVSAAEEVGINLVLFPYRLFEEN